MPDDWSRERAKPVAVGPPRRRADPRRPDPRRPAAAASAASSAVSPLAVLVAVVVGAVFLGSKMWHTMFGASNDYAGDGVSDVVIEVHDGDSTTAIGQTLQDHKVVATVKAFVDAAEGNSAISAIQPGFYKVRTEIPASNAVERLADPQSRVGKLVIPEGRQLDDIQDVKTNAVTDGIFTLISTRHVCESRRPAALRVGGRSAQGGGYGGAFGAVGARLGRHRGHGAGHRPPPVGRADRAGHLEHRPGGFGARRSCPR